MPSPGSGTDMKRRDFIAALGAAAMPLVARGQQGSPLIGLLASTSAAAPSGRVDAIHLALKQAGMEVGQAVRMEYRYGDNQPDRLPLLAAELVKMSPALIIATGGPAPALALKAATTTIPIVFAPLPDPVRSGLVASMNRPGGNITGIAALTIELDPKRLELLHELAPPGPIGVLLNPNRPDGHMQSDPIKAAAQAVGRQLVLAYAKNAAEIDLALPCSRSVLSPDFCQARMPSSPAKEHRSSCLPPATAGLRSINSANLSRPEGSRASERTCSIPTGKWEFSQHPSSRVKSPPTTCQ
jgi:ABC-type uncharacterized transport system substrate-binding protein